MSKHHQFVDDVNPDPMREPVTQEELERWEPVLFGNNHARDRRLAAEAAERLRRDQVAAETDAMIREQVRKRKMQEAFNAGLAAAKRDKLKAERLAALKAEQDRRTEELKIAAIKQRGELRSMRADALFETLKRRLKFNQELPGMVYEGMHRAEVAAKRRTAPSEYDKRLMEQVRKESGE